MSIDDFYEENRFQSDAHPRARKEHECCACHETIRRGDRYRRTTICDYDGGIETYRHCLRCAKICDALWNAGAGCIDMTLDCGHTWHENHTDGELKYPCPPEVERLAFMTADEAQESW